MKWFQVQGSELCVLRSGLKIWCLEFGLSLEFGILSLIFYPQFSSLPQPTKY